MEARLNDARISVVGFAVAAIVAFAANSVLCRVALRQGTIDPASFSTIRLMSGALTLLMISRWTPTQRSPLTISFSSAALLALYAVPFSFAYSSLSTGTGALILFGCVQVTMLAATVRAGERIHFLQWCGVIVALAGLAYLVAPALATPAFLPAVLMAIAGVSWGLYSWQGRAASNPLAATTGNFVLAVPVVALVSLIALRQTHVEAAGVILSIASGAIASGLGYVAWYSALRSLTGTQASVIQLAVPVLAAVGGVIFLAEVMTARLILSAILVLGGIALAIAGRARMLRRARYA